MAERECECTAEAISRNRLCEHCLATAKPAAEPEPICAAAPERGPCPGSPLPWNLDNPGCFADANGTYIAQRYTQKHFDADLAAIVHRVNNWDALWELADGKQEPVCAAADVVEAVREYQRGCPLKCDHMSCDISERLDAMCDVLGTATLRPESEVRAEERERFLPLMAAANRFFAAWPNDDAAIDQAFDDMSRALGATGDESEPRR